MTTSALFVDSAVHECNMGLGRLYVNLEEQTLGEYLQKLIQGTWPYSKSKILMDPELDQIKDQEGGLDISRGDGAFRKHTLAFWHIPEIDTVIVGTNPTTNEWRLENLCQLHKGILAQRDCWSFQTKEHHVCVERLTLFNADVVPQRTILVVKIATLLVCEDSPLNSIQGKGHFESALMQDCPPCKINLLTVHEDLYDKPKDFPR